MALYMALYMGLSFHLQLSTCQDATLALLPSPGGETSLLPFAPERGPLRHGAHATRPMALPKAHLPTSQNRTLSRCVA